MLVQVRLPRDQYDLVVAEMRRRGCNRGDVLAHAVALYLGMPDASPLAAAEDQHQIPMTA